MWIKSKGLFGIIKKNCIRNTQKADCSFHLFLPLLTMKQTFWIPCFSYTPFGWQEKKIKFQAMYSNQSHTDQSHTESRLFLSSFPTPFHCWHKRFEFLVFPYTPFAWREKHIQFQHIYNSQFHSRKMNKFSSQLSLEQITYFELHPMAWISS